MWPVRSSTSSALAGSSAVGPTCSTRPSRTRQGPIGNLAASRVHRHQHRRVTDQQGRHGSPSNPTERGRQIRLAPWFRQQSTRGGRRPARRRAAYCACSMAIVIGPTPPGTGVIAPATSLTSSKATSPTRRRARFAAGVGNAIDADVNDISARLDPIAAHHLGPAHGGNQDIGGAADAGQVARARVANGQGGSRAPAAAWRPAARRCSSGRAPPPARP